MQSQKIVPHLWFDTQAKEAAEFYVSAFGGDSAVTHVQTLTDTPSGDVDSVSFRLLGQEFQAISAGPYFKINPSISFFVNFDPSQDQNAKQSLTTLWEKLSEGGTPLMPLDAYPFSEWYGWIQDRYGVSWQLILSNPEGEVRPPITPSLLFVGGVAGKAEEAMRFYVSIFKDAKVGMVAKREEAQPPEQVGSVMYEDFMLLGKWIAAMDSAHPAHTFAFNEAVSLMVYCDDQEEIDYYWEKLSAVPEAEQCGWLKDQYGVSWQIVPRRMDEMMREGTPEQIARVTEAFLKMKKFDLAALEVAYAGT